MKKRVLSLLIASCFQLAGCSTFGGLFSRGDNPEPLTKKEVPAPEPTMPQQKAETAKPGFDLTKIGSLTFVVLTHSRLPQVLQKEVDATALCAQRQQTCGNMESLMAKIHECSERGDCRKSPLPLWLRITFGDKPSPPDEEHDVIGTRNFILPFGTEVIAVPFRSDICKVVIPVGTYELRSWAWDSVKTPQSGDIPRVYAYVVVRCESPSRAVIPKAKTKK